MTFEVNEPQKALEEAEEIRTVEKLTIDAVRYKEKRSLDANAYFWVLADKIAKKLKSDKWTIYLLQLSKHGVFVDMQVKREAVSTLRGKFRYSEILDEYPEFSTVRCYFGSSSYDSQEMSDLIAGTVEDAKELGIETMTPDEIKALVAAWKGGKVDGY